MNLRAERNGSLLPPIGSRMKRSRSGGVSAASYAEIGSSRVDRVFGFDRELDGSSELERDLRSFGIQEGSSEFLDELRTRLGFRF